MIKYSLFICFILSWPLSNIYAETPEDAQKLFDKGGVQYQVESFQAAYESFTGAIRIYQQNGKQYEDKVMQAELWAGAAAFHLGRLDDSESHYLKSLHLAEKLTSVEYRINVHTALANLYAARQRYNDAAIHYLKSGAIYAEAGKTKEASQSTEYGGYMKFMAGQYRDSYDIFHTAIINHESERPENELAWLYSMRAISSYYLNDLESALTDFNIAIETLSKSGAGPSPDLTRYHGWAGKIYFETGDHEQAMVHFEKSLEMAKKIGSKPDESLAYASMGFYYATAKDFEKGAMYYEMSLKINQDLNLESYIIANFDSLSWIYREAGLHQKSLEAYEELLYYYDDKSLKSAEILNQIGLRHYYLKNYEEAIEAFEESLFLYRNPYPDKNQNYFEEIAVVLLNSGVAYEAAGKTKQATLAIEESLKMSIEKGNLSNAEDSFSFLTDIFQNEFNTEKLISLMEKMIPLYSKPDKQKELSNLYNNIGIKQYSLERYEQAIEYYEKAFLISKKENLTENQAIQLHNMAQANARLSRFDTALDIYLRAKYIAQKNNHALVEGNILNSMGEVYRAWGWYAKSLEYYNLAEKIFQKHNYRDSLVSVYNNMGQAIRQTGKPEDSIVYYTKALELLDIIAKNKDSDPGSEDIKTRALLLSNLGEANRESGQLQEALELYIAALKLDTKIHNLRGITIRRNNIALIHQTQGNHKKALTYFKDGLQYWKSLGDKQGQAIALSNLGHSSYFLKNYDKAIQYFTQAVEIHEELRLTAKGTVRREYLANQISVYRDLALSYFEKGQLWKSLYALELSRAKYLLEQMGDTNVVPDANTFRRFQKTLKKSDRLLSVVTLGPGVFHLILIDRKTIRSTVSYTDKDFLNEFHEKYARQIKRRLKTVQADPFETMIYYYRYLLSTPVRSRSDRQAFDEISSYLYSLWIEPFGGALENVQSIRIIPDGILGTIPFETLRDKEGKYLVEKYDINYAQSITVMQQIQQRQYDAENGVKRKTLIAFGAPVYQTEPVEENEQTKIDNTGNMDGIRQMAEHLTNTGGNTRALYSYLGYDIWSDLPGTLAELRQISKIIPDTRIITGEDASETNVKKLSDDGQLAQYKVIHFATHGIVIPEVPELSAIVLSLNQQSKKNNDGYLTMKEVSKLKIKADFVNLSACNTGLGKVYEGEGVVGLTQAFLIAGANSLSVSLWQVSDNSTMKFMSGLYNLVWNENLSYSQAISKMKRKFIKDEALNHPFYWAPFVFYGGQIER
ncbi:MAG: CHAT domain-containing protein [Leptospirales bacterium]